MHSTIPQVITAEEAELLAAAERLCSELQERMFKASPLQAEHAEHDAMSHAWYMGQASGQLHAAKDTIRSLRIGLRVSAEQSAVVY